MKPVRPTPEQGYGLLEVPSRKWLDLVFVGPGSRATRQAQSQGGVHGHPRRRGAAGQGDFNGVGAPLSAGAGSDDWAEGIACRSCCQ